MLQRLACCLILLLWLPSAQGEEQSVPDIRESLYVQLVEAQDCVMASPPLPCAAQILGKVSELTDLSNYEANLVLILWAWFYFQNHDNQAAIQAFQSLLSQPELRPGSHRYAMWNLCELHFREKQYQDALDAVDRAIAREADPDTRLLGFRTKVVDAMSGKRQIRDREELERVVAEMFESVVAGYHCRLTHRRSPSFSEFTGASSVKYMARGSACEEPLLELERRGLPLRIHFVPPPEPSPRPSPVNPKPKHLELILENMGP